MTSISADMGGSRLKSALVSNGQVIESAVLPINPSAPMEECLALLEKEVHRLAVLHTAPSVLGIAFPGLVNPNTHRVISTSGKYEGFVDFDFCTWSQEHFQMPLILENDANAALLGELNYGCGQGCDNAVLMILGTGIGTATMIEGKLLRGKHFQAGCLGGHISVETLAKGKTCSCGSIGCAESIGSGWALKKAAGLDYQALLKAEQEGDAAAHQLMEKSVDAWSTCAINLIHAYDPDMLILSGGILHCGERIIRPIADNITKYAWTPWGNVELKVAEIPEHSVVLGLHYLCCNSNF